MGTARYHTLGSVQSNFPSRSTIYLAAAVAVFCAAGMFFLLCERDHSLMAETSGPPPAPTVIETMATVNTPMPAPAQAASSRPKTESPGREIPFTVERSRRFERIGPVSIGVWRIDSRRESVDLSILADGHRMNQNRVKPDEEIPIDVKNSNRRLKLVVKRIDKNSVSGALVEN